MNKSSRSETHLYNLPRLNLCSSRDDRRLLTRARRGLLLVRRRRSGLRALHAIECSIRGRQEFFNGLPVFRENGAADGHRDRRTFFIRCNAFADSLRNLLGLC